ncbi:BPSL0067 family protein [Janthinobacterium sp. Mn2066]|uniref:BPSL0067 family protein n=1 Tax=Janthinobacterium sp. Mn2066 TaxID=3395264 RepID=UPI003BD395DA
MAYIYSKAARLKNQPVVGSRHCVALVQEYAGAPATAHWRQGAAVAGNTTLTPGTAIATFAGGRHGSHGHHAALYVRQGINGIIIVDQWQAASKSKISLRLIQSQGQDQRGHYRQARDNADAFFVIE